MQRNLVLQSTSCQLFFLASLSNIPVSIATIYLHNGEVDSQAVGGTANAFAAAIQDVRVKVPSQIFTFDNIDLSICSTDFCRPLSIAFAPAPFFRCPGR
jgi:hypothetical protein